MIVAARTCVLHPATGATWITLEYASQYHLDRIQTVNVLARVYALEHATAWVDAITPPGLCVMCVPDATIMEGAGVS